MLTPEQQLQRRRGVGGSDCAAACGISRHKTRYQLWAEKTGVLEPADLSQNESIYWGNAHEPAIAKRFEELNAVALESVGDTFVSPTVNCMLGHIDRRLVGRREGLEIKTVGWRSAKNWGEPGTADIPEEYFMQCQHYLAVTGYDRWYVAALIGGNEYRQYTIERNEHLIQDIENLVSYFWSLVLSKTPPSLDNEGDCKIRYPAVLRNTFHQAEDADMENVGRYRTLVARSKEIERELEELRVLFKERIADTQGLARNDEILFTWRDEARSNIDSKRLREKHPELAKDFTKTTTTRVFRAVGV